jgi:MtN3 and saliva related transmembrane protein
MTTALGLLAGTLTTGCWLPQLVRSWRTRSTEDLSWLYLLLLSAGVTLWSIYGIVIADIAVILTNVSSLAFLLILVGIKALGDRPDARTDPDGSPSSVGASRSTLRE